MNAFRTATRRALFAALLLTFGFGYAQETNAPDALLEMRIRELLEVSGSVDSSQQMMDQMTAYMRTSLPETSEEFERFAAALDVDVLTERLIPVYAKYYSLEDIEAMIAFYKSPVGQRLLAVQPMVMQESMEIGAQWGEETMMQIFAELGYSEYGYY